MARKKLDSKKMMAGFIAFIMISSIFGVIMGSLSEDSGNEYNGFKFKATNTGLVTTIDKQDYIFYSMPFDVEAFNMSDGVLPLIKAAQAYNIVFDPNIEELTSVDLLRLDLTQFFMSQNKIIGYGVTEESDTYPQIGVLDCQNATQFWPVILFKDGEESSVTISEENPFCIVVESETYIHRIRFRDALLYRILGVIEE
jgi:hypothetical protein